MNMKIDMKALNQEFNALSVEQKELHAAYRRDHNDEDHARNDRLDEIRERLTVISEELADAVAKEEFVWVWTDSQSLDEVAKRLRCLRITAKITAIRYRKEGIPLKRFVSRGVIRTTNT